MATTKQIMTAIQNTERFRNWFRRLPEEKINLDRVMAKPFNGNTICLVEISSFQPRYVLNECGAVGCVGGWLKHYLYMKKITYSEYEFLGTHLIPGASYIFSVRQKRWLTQREEALERLTNHIQNLKALL